MRTEREKYREILEEEVEKFKEREEEGERGV